MRSSKGATSDGRSWAVVAHARHNELCVLSVLRLAYNATAALGGGEIRLRELSGGRLRITWPRCKV